MSITDYIHGSIGEEEFVVLVDKERLTEADQREAPYWIDVKNGNEDEPIPEILLQYICLLVAFQ